MKIAISTNGKDETSLLDKRFGRCEYFQIYDSDNSDIKVVENKGLVAGGGAGIAAVQQIIDENINVIITGSLGPNAFNIIEKAKIKAYKGEEISIKSILEKFNNNELVEITNVEPVHKGVGH